MNSLKDLSFTSLISTTKVKILNIHLQNQHHIRCSDFDIKIKGMHIYAVKLKRDYKPAITTARERRYKCATPTDLNICLMCNHITPRKLPCDTPHQCLSTAPYKRKSTHQSEHLMSHPGCFNSNKNQPHSLQQIALDKSITTGRHFKIRSIHAEENYDILSAKFVISINKKLRIKTRIPENGRFCRQCHKLFSVKDYHKLLDSFNIGHAYLCLECLLTTPENNICTNLLH